MFLKTKNLWQNHAAIPFKTENLPKTYRVGWGYPELDAPSLW